jgi:beta-ureidopropionase / N-carbamoyl-L-amino-acid hydrolase
VDTAAATAAFRSLWEPLLPLGRDERTGGYRRSAWTAADAACREWFRDAASARRMEVHVDRNGNLWAWWGPPGPGALVLGSHLDSVPDGGAYDGPLGVVSAFAALDLVGAAPGGRAALSGRPVAVVAFADEEGARFGVACMGSRLLTGSLDPDRARGLTDVDGTTLAEALTAAGHDPAWLGRDDEALARVGELVELHVEQGRHLVDVRAPLGVATAIWPHGRYRFTFTGEANHAGTTRLEDRRDPMLTYAETVLAARKKARLADARVTFGRVEVEPNGTNAIPSTVRAWLDARAADEIGLADLVASIDRGAHERADRDGTVVEVVAESVSPVVAFDPDVSAHVAAAARDGDAAAAVPHIPTQAGHDAGVLAAHVPAAMLFVRNPTGVSHSPAEHADESDCVAGVRALARLVVARTVDGGAG